MHRREFLMVLTGFAAGASVCGLNTPASAASTPPPLDRAVAAVAETDAEFSFLIGRLTHRRRAGWWWRRRVVAARRWGRRGRPGRH